jgi:hypothetical protein
MTTTFTLISIAAICNAIMDIVSHKFLVSIFNSKRFNRQFWDAELSWRNKYVGLSPQNGRRKLFWNINLHPAFTDAFHLFKTIMIFAFIGAIATCPTNNIKESLFVFIVGGIIYNCTFSLFYKLILIRK